MKCFFQENADDSSNLMLVHSINLVRRTVNYLYNFRKTKAVMLINETLIIIYIEGHQIY